jgi:integrase
MRISAALLPRRCGKKNLQLLADGVHPKIAQERLGHSTITTTMDLYSHVTDTMQADAAARLDAAFRSAINGRVSK